MSTWRGNPDYLLCPTHHRMGQEGAALEDPGEYSRMGILKHWILLIKEEKDWKVHYA